jgi:hypothetical protein
MRGPGWSDSARRAVEEHQAALDEEATIAGERAALEDQRIAREREREAEAVADEFTRIKEPSAREKFFDENEATMVGSKRYNNLAKCVSVSPASPITSLPKTSPTRSTTLTNGTCSSVRVAKGAGTLAAREEADRFRMRRGAVAALTKAGVHPTEANRIADEEGYSPEVINYHVAQQENESSFPKDRQAQALEKRYRVLKDRASLEDDGDGITPQTAEELRRVSLLLDEKYKLIAEPFINGEAAADAGAVLPRSQRTPAAAPAAAPETPEQKMRKKYNID